MIMLEILYHFSLGYNTRSAAVMNEGPLSALGIIPLVGDKFNETAVLSGLNPNIPNLNINTVGMSGYGSGPPTVAPGGGLRSITTNLAEQQQNSSIFRAPDSLVLNRQTSNNSSSTNAMPTPGLQAFSMGDSESTVQHSFGTAGRTQTQRQAGVHLNLDLRTPIHSNPGSFRIDPLLQQQQQLQLQQQQSSNSQSASFVPYGSLSLSQSQQQQRGVSSFAYNSDNIMAMPRQVSASNNNQIPFSDSSSAYFPVNYPSNSRNASRLPLPMTLSQQPMSSNDPRVTTGGRSSFYRAAHSSSTVSSGLRASNHSGSTNSSTHSMAGGNHGNLGILPRQQGGQGGGRVVYGGDMYRQSSQDLLGDLHPFDESTDLQFGGVSGGSMINSREGGSGGGYGDSNLNLMVSGNNVPASRYSSTQSIDTLTHNASTVSFNQGQIPYLSMSMASMGNQSSSTDVGSGLPSASVSHGASLLEMSSPQFHQHQMQLQQQQLQQQQLQGQQGQGGTQQQVQGKSL